MALTGKPKIGKLKKFYIDVDGSIASPTWVLVGTIQGLSKNSSRAVAELEERGEDEVLVMIGHKTNEVTFQLSCRPGQTIYDAIETAYQNGTKIGIAVMTGVITDVDERGYQAEVYVTQFDDDQAHTSSAISVTVRAAADYTTAPAHVEISS